MCIVAVLCRLGVTRLTAVNRTNGICHIVHIPLVRLTAAVRIGSVGCHLFSVKLVFVRIHPCLPHVNPILSQSLIQIC